jgi:hypothetical protein
MIEDRASTTDPALVEALRVLEQRLARLETHLALPPLMEDHAEEASLAAERAAAAWARPAAEQDLEFVVGQNWLASVGILVLTCGVGFALLLPFAGLPPYLPSLAGGAVAVALLLLSVRWRTTFELVASYFRGAGIALMYFAVFRLFFFGDEHMLAIDSLAGPLLLSAVVIANVAAAIYLESVWLMAIALFTGFVTVVAVGTPWFAFVGTALLLGANRSARLAREREEVAF